MPQIEIGTQAGQGRLLHPCTLLLLLGRAGVLHAFAARIRTREYLLYPSDGATITLPCVGLGYNGQCTGGGAMQVWLSSAWRAAKLACLKGGTRVFLRLHRGG